MKKYNQRVTSWLIAEVLSTFFKSLDDFEYDLKEYFTNINFKNKKIENIKGTLLKLEINEELKLHYDDLFCGTNYKVYIPLWASASKNKGKILLNETTLKVIHFYHKWGYNEEIINKNPADFIGTQLKFIAYLNACYIYEVENSTGCEALFIDAINEFLQLSLIDTVEALVKGVRSNSNNEFILNVIDMLVDFVFDENSIDFEIKSYFNFDKFKNIPSYNVINIGRHNEIKNEEKKVIKTGGFNNCGGKCVISGHVRDGCVLDIKTDDSENSPQVRACVRGRGYRYTYFNSERLRYPMKRIGKRGEGKFKKISWDEAIDTIYKNWVRIRDNYGPSSRFVMYSWGMASMIRPDNMARRLLSLDGGYLDGYNTYSDAATVYVSPYIFGDSTSGNDADDVLNTNLLILWGHNPAETIFGSEKNYYITKAKEKGVKVIVIDPRQSDSALTYADEWIGIRPSTDSALADGMAYVIWSENLMDKEFMDKYCVGFDKNHMPAGVDGSKSYESYLFGKQDGVAKTPKWASEITGVEESKIIEIAREYAKSKPACIMPGLGLQRTGNGEQTTRSLAMLACLTGNVGIKGGGTGASIWSKKAATINFPTLKNPYKGEIPNFLWSSVVDRGIKLSKKDGLVGVDKLDSNIKMIFNLAGNTLINQHSNINETAKILQDESKCEFIVCSDIFMTPSARFSDIVLPAASGFEIDNMSPPWLNGEYILYNNKLVDPFFDCKFEYEWIREVAKKLGYLDKFDGGHSSVEDWMKDLYSQMRDKEKNLVFYEEIKLKGIHKWKKETPFIAYEDQIKDIENNPFKTPSGKIEIYSKTLRDMDNKEIPPIPKYVECVEGPSDKLREKYPLQLIGWHTKRRTHSIHDNNALMEEVSPQVLWIHPDDAEIRNIKEGDTVKVFNDRGIVKIKAHITNRIVSGVCAMPQGAWYTPDKDGVDTRGCINVLTSTHKPTPLAKGNPQHTNLVEVIGG